MTDSAASILELQLAAKRRKRAEAERHSASAELRQRVRDAHDAGVPITRIAREGEISRQAVYEMLGIRLLSRRVPGSLQ